MEQAKQHYLSSVASLAELRAKRKELDSHEARCISKGTELRGEIADLEQRFEQSKLDLLLGRSNSEAVKALGVQLEQAKEAMDQAGRDRVDIGKARRQLETEIQESSGLITKNLEAYVAALSRPLETKIKKDPKLREQLIQLYAMRLLATDQGLGAKYGVLFFWDNLLEDVFSAPEQAEIDAAYEGVHKEFAR